MKDSAASPILRFGMAPGFAIRNCVYCGLTVFLLALA